MSTERQEHNARAPRLHTGRIKVHPDGYGFVVPDDQSEDIHVSARARGSSMDADRVEVEWWPGPRGIEGRVTRVIERGRGKITGQIATAGSVIVLLPDDARVGGTVSLPKGPGGAQPGQSVVAQIERYPERPGDVMEAVVLKVLGHPDDPRTEIEKILACADIEEAFPADVARAAAAVPRQISVADRVDREDLRHVPFATIDPETARDFDDAVAVEVMPGGGHRLWVAVADVSHYVREGTPLDVEAQRRGCSVYLPNRAIPMLPEELSGHLCSLVPGEDRLAMVVRIDLDRNADTTAVDFMAAVIHSHARLDYPGVAAALAGDTRGKREKYEPFVPSLRIMDALAGTLRARRKLRGALDLDLPEPVVELDRDDPALVRDVRRSRRDPGEKQAYAMIEEFMLAANEAVGESFKQRNEDTLWRIHDVPDATKLDVFAGMAESYGFQVDVEEARSPRGLAAVLARLKGQPAEKPLSFQLLRSLKQASYDLVNVGHFGLASTAYLHFTSPIRRYPDVVVHRLLKRRLATLKKPAGGFLPMTATPLPPAGPELVKAAHDSSFSERKAMEVEREVMDLYRAFFMRDRVGDKFPGTITAVTGFGLFVSIDEPFVEGLVRTEELGLDSFELDDVAMRLRGRRSGRMFALGDRIEVEILSVSVPRRRIELRLVGAPARAPGVPAGGWRDRARERSGGRARAAKHEGRPADARRGGSASAARPAAHTAGGSPGEPRGRQDKAADRRAPTPARDTARGGASKPGRAAGGRPGGKPSGGGKRGRRR